MSQVYLPPIPVTASPIGIGPSPNPDVRPAMGHPAVVQMQARAQRDQAYTQGLCLQMFSKLLETVKFARPPYSLVEPLKHDLVTAHHADYLQCFNPQMSLAETWKAGRARANTLDLHAKPQLTSETELSGSVISVLKAYAHYLLGNGTPMTWRLEKIGIQPTVEKLPTLQQAINLAGPGITNIDVSFGYDTGADSKIAMLILGNITLRTTGQVVRHESGFVTFTGEVRAYHDVYDFNASTHRTVFTEAATTAGRLVGENIQAVPYEIHMPGSIPISHNIE